MPNALFYVTITYGLPARGRPAVPQARYAVLGLDAGDALGRLRRERPALFQLLPGEGQVVTEVTLIPEGYARLP